MHLNRTQLPLAVGIRTGGSWGCSSPSAHLQGLSPGLPGRTGEHKIWTGFHFWKTHPPEIPTIKEAGGKWRLISEEIKATGFVLFDFFISLHTESYPASS